MRYNVFNDFFDDKLFDSSSDYGLYVDDKLSD